MASLDKVKVTNSGYLRVCHECNDCKDTLADLPTENVEINTIYFVRETEKNYQWTGTEWIEAGGEYEFSGSGGSGGDIPELSYADFLAGNYESGKTYYIPDYPYSNGKAKDIGFDDTTANLGVDNTQDAIDVNSKDIATLISEINAMKSQFISGVLEVSGTTGATKSFTIPSDGFLITGNWNCKAVYFVSGAVTGTSMTPTKIHSYGSSYVTVSVSGNTVTLTNTNSAYRQVYSFRGLTM